MAARHTATLAWLFAALCLFATSPRAQAEEPLLLLCSIRPLQLIAAEIGGEEFEVRALASASASPHAFVLRPSERRELSDARLFLWMGAALERPLEQLLQRQPPRAALALLPAIGPEGVDPHVWLDPRAAVSMARAMASAIVRETGAAQQTLDARLAAFEASMRVRKAQTAALLEPLRATPFLAMHDGYRGFVARYGLRQVAALPGDHGHQPGARSLASMRRVAHETGAVCLLRQADDSAALARSIARDAGLRIVEVDPLAARAADFDTFLATFAADVARCLTDGPEKRGTLSS
ncbi:MAG: metal ABC transporter solute-binding protein, Zn/Mn family [Gammaproteobacteria bacterium]